MNKLMITSSVQGIRFWVCMTLILLSFVSMSTHAASQYDGDGDGVSNWRDRCPETPVGTTVDSTGCEITEPAPVDSDGDGINDGLDACPNQGDTGYGIDASGCPNPIPDSDSDGLDDSVDACPNQGDFGYGIDANGCPNPIPDSDSDGLDDSVDACPNQGYAGYGIDASGCPNPIPDSDSDGLDDSVDACPNQGDGDYGIDASGCPNPIPDSDSDGLDDSVDACPNQGDAGYGVDATGCPNAASTATVISAIDSDGDGLDDGVDVCPNQGDTGYGIDATGCPISLSIPKYAPTPSLTLDSDGDGVIDEKDICPNRGDEGYGVFGHGCPKSQPTPLLDSDNDGITDDLDNCPKQGNQGYGLYGDGCPKPEPASTSCTTVPRSGSNLSILGECAEPADCFSCHKDAERFPVLAGRNRIVNAHPDHRTMSNCFECHGLTSTGVGLIGSCLEGCHLNLTDAPTNEMGLPLTVIGSPESGTNRHHYTDTFKNESCHTCHVLPETELTSSAICVTCHDGSVAKKDIVSSFNQPYAHPLDVLGRASGSGEQVSCLDCHNPNQVTGDNLLKGVEGVQPDWPGSWQSVTSFAPVQVEQQYQLCLKCHSYNKFGNNPPTNISGQQMTDQAREFNPNNMSGHRVVANEGASWNDFKMTVGGTVYDYSSSFVDGMAPDTILECANCHSDADKLDVKGPHGSSIPRVLEKPWSLNTGKGSTNDLCFKCHKAEVYGGAPGNVNDWTTTGFSESREYRKNLHQYHVYQKGWDCTDCHVKVPHGWKRKAFLYYNIDGRDEVPYNGQPNASWGIDTDTQVDSVESGQWAQQVCHDGNRHPGSCS